MRKAFLLGAGLGTRLRPLTNSLPKPLIPVFHRPLIAYALDHCLAAGIEEFAINTHHLPDAWERAFPEGHYRGAPLTFFHEPDLLETGGGIKNIADWIGDDPILIYNGDILTDCAIGRLISALENSSDVATLATRSTGPSPHLAVAGDRVVDIRKLRGLAEGTMQFTGLYCITPEILDLIPPAEKVSVIPAFLQLAEAGRLGHCPLDEGEWLDLGTREAYLAAHGLLPGANRPEMLASQHPAHPEALIDEDAKISNSIVGPGALVPAGAEVDGSILWPGATVAAGAQLTNCIVHSSNPASGQHQDADL